MKKLAENFIQQSCVMPFHNNYCLEHHSPRCVVFSVPNESENSYETQKKVNTGLLRGASDVIVLIPMAVCLFLECKTEIGQQSIYQKKFQKNVEALGFPYHIFRSTEQFWNIVNPYLIAAGLEVYNG